MFGSAETVLGDIDKAIDWILEKVAASSVHVVAISRGAVPAGYYAALHPRKVKSLTLHAPITKKAELHRKSSKNCLGHLKYLSRQPLHCQLWIDLSFWNLTDLLAPYQIWSLRLSVTGRKSTEALLHRLPKKITAILKIGKSKLLSALQSIFLMLGKGAISIRER